MDVSKISPEQAEVWQTITAFNQAFAANDVDTYFSYIDEDLVVIIPSAPYRIEGKAADREEFEYSLSQGKTRIGYFQELQPLVRVFGDTAYVTYHSRGSYGPEGRVIYLKETDILVKRVGGWKIVHIHVSATV